MRTSLTWICSNDFPFQTRPKTLISYQKLRDLGLENPRMMHVDERISNGSVANRSLSAERAEELITYKRRKHSKPCTDAGVRVDGSVSVAAPCLLSDQGTNDPHNMVFINNANKENGHAGIDCPVLQICADDSVHGHWEKVLEQMLQSPNVSEGGIQNCIQYALASSTSGLISNNATTKQTAQEKEPIYCHGDGHTNHLQLQRVSQKPNGLWNAANEYQVVTLDRSRKEPKDQTNARSVTERCQNVFLDVIVSDKFSLLCNLLCRNFQGIKADGIFDFNLINSRMEKGQYEESSEVFALDIQQVWKKFEKIGEEMVRLAKSLSNISRASYCKQVGDLVKGAIGEWKDEEINQVGIEEKDSLDLNTIKRFNSNVKDPCTKLERSEACGLNKICTCKHCGAEADGKRRLVCDGCEAMYHISCIKPPVEEIPSKSWYCAACSENGKESPEPDSTQNCGEILHQNCVVCERLTDMGTQACDGENHTEKMCISDDTEETSDSSAEDDRLQESHRIISSRLCKLCKTGEEVDKRFIVCEHKQCPYKYYHRRCLRYKQITRFDEHWYCPSCLCRSCFINRDDDKIVLCDGCDEAYHIYCMVPPRTTIPRGNWYCMFCMIEIRARCQMEIKCEGFTDKRMKKIARKPNRSAGGSVDMLLSAAEKLSSQDKPATKRKNW